MMKKLATEIDIAVSPERVWKILTDTSKFSEWNPFITSVEGRLEVNSRLVVTIAPPGRTPMVFKPSVEELDHNRKLSWLGHLVVPGLFDGKHEFIIEALSTHKLRFIHREQFTGLLVPLLWKSMEQSTRAGFELMNEALKARAETTTA